jgi:hypothetical protein
VVVNARLVSLTPAQEHEVELAVALVDQVPRVLVAVPLGKLFPVGWARLVAETQEICTCQKNYNLAKHKKTRLILSNFPFSSYSPFTLTDLLFFSFSRTSVPFFYSILADSKLCCRQTYI